jgi:hypothetical protein
MFDLSDIQNFPDKLNNVQAKRGARGKNPPHFLREVLCALCASAFRFCPAISQAMKMGMALGKRRHD